MRRYLYILLLSALVIGCEGRGGQIRTGYLVFVGVPAGRDADEMSMDAAISAATGTDNPLSITHVAIIELTKDGIWIIDATPKRGVARRPLETFIDDNMLEDGSLPEFVVKRVDGVAADAALLERSDRCLFPS